MAGSPQISYDAYEAPQSLWKLVEENVSPGEREEIREILGVTLVEESLDLQNEVGLESVAMETSG